MDSLVSWVYSNVRWIGLILWDALFTTITAYFTYGPLSSLWEKLVEGQAGSVALYIRIRFLASSLP